MISDSFECAVLVLCGFECSLRGTGPLFATANPSVCVPLMCMSPVDKYVRKTVTSYFKDYAYTFFKYVNIPRAF